jgi:hypothetical protein
MRFGKPNVILHILWNYMNFNQTDQLDWVTFYNVLRFEKVGVRCLKEINK